MISANKLRDIIFKKAHGDNTISAQLYQMFFFEKILERISISKYKENVILKGGLLLSSIIGEDMRTTKDMDITLKSLPLTRKEITKIIQEIIEIPLNDQIQFELIEVKDIRMEDEYGGFRINLLGKLERLKINVILEFTTGDKITPKEIDYKYISIFDKHVIPIFAYNLETIISEKFETVISRGVLNTRLKDFYDLYILMNHYPNFDTKTLYQAINNTFQKRQTTLNIKNIEETITLLSNDQHMESQWLNYQKKYSFAKEIEYSDILKSLEKIIDIIKKA